MTFSQSCHMSKSCPGWLVQGVCICEGVYFYQLHYAQRLASQSEEGEKELARSAGSAQVPDSFRLTLMCLTPTLGLPFSGNCILSTATTDK